MGTRLTSVPRRRQLQKVTERDISGLADMGETPDAL